MNQSAAFLSETELINSGLLETSIDGVYGLLTFISDETDAQVYAVIELTGNDWNMIYFASESVEDAQDVFGIYDEAALEVSFGLFDNAAAAIGQAA